MPGDGSKKLPKDKVDAKEQQKILDGAHNKDSYKQVVRLQDQETTLA